MRERTKIFRGSALSSLALAVFGSWVGAAAAQDDVPCSLEREVFRNVVFSTKVITPDDLEIYALRSRSLKLRPRSFDARSDVDEVVSRDDGGFFEVSYDPLNAGGVINLLVPIKYSQDYSSDLDVIKLFAGNEEFFDELDISMTLTIDNGRFQYDLERLRDFTMTFSIDDLSVFSGRASVAVSGVSARGDIKFRSEYTLIMLPTILEQMDDFAAAHQIAMEAAGFCVDGGKRYYKPG